jgi:tRNA pseudouridine55 synthase
MTVDMARQLPGNEETTSAPRNSIHHRKDGMTTANLSGLLVIDKPSGITSRVAVNRVQQALPRGTRIGHAGTLDPLATGVLVLCIGTATRLVEYIQDLDKEYVTDLTLGAVSDSDDADGAITPVAVESPPTREAIAQAVQHFVGNIEQVPPAFSAAHVAGQRAYKLARRGKEVALAPRRVRIDSIDLLDFRYPDLRLRIRCGKGTYIRSLARDLGNRLGCGAFVRTLQRTRIGPFTAEHALAINSAKPEQFTKLLPLATAVAHLPPVHLTAAEFERLRQGQVLQKCDVDLPAGDDSVVALFLHDALVGLGSWQRGTRSLRPDKILAGARDQ